MIKKLFYYLFFILVIFAASFLWPIIELPYLETTIVGEYKAKRYNYNNDLIRYLVFIFIPVVCFLIIKSFNFRENIHLLLNKFEDFNLLDNYKNNHINLLFLFLIIFAIFEFLSINFPIHPIDTFHEGQQMSSAYKYRTSGVMWSGSYVTVGIIYETIASNLIWNFFEVVSIGSTRYLNLFYIFLLKILILINLYQITILTNLKKLFKLILLLSVSIIGVNLIGYDEPVGQFIWREIFTFLTLIVFFQILLKPKYINFLSLIFGPLSCLSIFWSLDRGITCNILIFVFLIYFLFSKNYKSFLITIISIIISWVFTYFYLGDEFNSFIQNTFSILGEINQIGGIVHPIPFSDDSNSSRATKSLLLISSALLISLNLMFSKNTFINNKFILCISIISVVAFLSYGYATGRSDGPHIKSSFGFVAIFYSTLIMYVALYKISKLELSKKVYKFEKILPAILILFSLFIYDLNYKNIINYKDRVIDYVNIKDEKFLRDNEKNFLIKARKITKNYNCIQLFTNDVMFLYLLRKPSCTKYYYPIVIGSEKNQKNLIKMLEENEIIITDKYTHNFSPNFRLIYVRDYINNNYSEIFSEDAWIIKKNNK